MKLYSYGKNGVTDKGAITIAVSLIGNSTLQELGFVIGFMFYTFLLQIKIKHKLLLLSKLLYHDRVHAFDYLINLECFFDVK